MVAEKNYTTQFQAGLGMVPETLELLRIWEPGMTPSALADLAVQTGVFSRATARRARNLAAEMFAPRYLAQGAEVAARLRFLISRRFPQDGLLQLFFLQTARAQRILADFVVDVYWPKYSAGATSVTKLDAEDFIQRALDAGRMKKRWSESTVHRVSGYLLGCCTDFGLLGGGTSPRPIKRFSVQPDVSLYLVHDLHFSGMSDRDLVHHGDWRLFGLEPAEVLRLVHSLSHDGHVVVQSGADLVQISWKYRSMEECLNALTQR
jgi:hypothetical protein